MSNDYLETARKKTLADDSNISEAELHATNESIRDSWLELQDIKRRISAAKEEASKKVDDDFKDELDAAVSSYALLITFSR